MKYRERSEETNIKRDNLTYFTEVFCSFVPRKSTTQQRSILLHILGLLCICFDNPLIMLGTLALLF